MLVMLIAWYAGAIWLNAPQAEALMDPDQPARLLGHCPSLLVDGSAGAAGAGPDRLGAHQ